MFFGVGCCMQFTWLCVEALLGLISCDYLGCGTLEGKT